MTIQPNTIQAFDTSLALTSLMSDASIRDVLDDAPVLGGTHHRVYNFEVADTHTYVADDIRVHNTSVLSFLDSRQLANLTRLEDTDNNGRPDFAVFRVPGSTTEVEVTMEGAGGSEQALFEVTESDGNGNLVYSSYERDLEGNIIESSVREISLVGQQLGASVAAVFTPFLTNALLDEDAGLFEEISATTVLGTVLENMG